MKKRIFVFGLLNFLVVYFSFSGVLSYPRKISLLKTKNFDIIYTSESSKTASYVANNADIYFKKAQSLLNTNNNFKIPVVIIPNSDVLSISYSSYPYNRIQIFDGVPLEKQLSFEDAFGSMLYREIYLAVAQSIMSPFNQFIHDTIGGEKYTPTSFFNLPSSIVEGYGYLVESEFDYTKINDGYFLQLLSEAKIEGNFPSWFQVFATRDIYPKKNLLEACGTAFCAFLIQSRGIEKYAEFWKECGNLHPYFAAGIIYKVYKKRIKDLWKEFEESIPLPDNLEKMRQLETRVDKVFEDYECVYNNIVYSDYGVVWYDEIQHEVNIYDLDSNFSFKRKLFSADGITHLSISPDGRFLCVSFIQENNLDIIKNNYTKIYDLQKKVFIGEKYNIRDSSIIKLANGENVIAGVNVDLKIPILQIYASKKLGAKKDELLYEFKFPTGVIPFSLNYAGNGKIIYIKTYSTKTSLVLHDIEAGKQEEFILYDENEKQLKIKKLMYQNTGTQHDGEELYTFQFSNGEQNSLTRMGKFVLDNNVPTELLLQQNDFYGGVHYPVITNGKVFFTSKKIFYDELKTALLSDFDFHEGRFDYSEENEPVQINENLFIEEKQDKNKIFNYDVLKYSFFTYWQRFSFVPFVSIKKITFENGPKSDIGLGFQIKLLPDPLMNHKLDFSACYTFLDLSYFWNIKGADNQKQRIIEKNTIDKKDKTFAIYYENTATPFDIKSSCLFRFNNIGEYDYEAMTGLSLTRSLGFTFNKLEFSVIAEYKASTDYFDENLSELFVSKTNFPTFSESYETVNLFGNVMFSNIRQYGSSLYEKIGFSCGIVLYSVWDVFKYRNEEKLRLSNGEGVEINNSIKPYPNVSQIFGGCNASISVPNLFPVNKNKNGWVIGLPTTASFKLTEKLGTALSVNVETLLLGKEVQNGFSFINLYFNRIGVKVGYDFALKYDTENIPVPDVRHFDRIGDIFSYSSQNNSFYILLNIDFLFPIGLLSKRIISSEFKTTFFPETNGYTFNLDFTVHF